MNRAQKNAWFGLGFSLVADFLIAFMIFLSFTFLTLPRIFAGLSFAGLTFGVLLFCSLLFRRRQTNDIDADERDSQISSLAIKICFASVWPLLLLVSLWAVFLVGVAGPVPAILLIFIHVGVFVVAATVYFASILILYGKCHE
jgi:hypothetical protein